MKLNWGIAAFLFGTILAAPPAFACSVKLMPDTHHLERYSTIFIGEVSSIRQMDYEEQQSSCYANGFNPSNCQVAVVTELASPVYDIFVLARITISGSPAAITPLHLQGCGIQVPQLGGYGIFFIPKDSKQPIVPIYQSESFLYSNLLLKLGNLKPGSSYMDKVTN